MALTVLFALGLAAVLTPDADAGLPMICLADPTFGDGKVREQGDAYAGNGVYNCDGEDQTALGVKSPGDKFKFDVKVKNDSAKTRDVHVAAVLDDGPGPVPTDFKFKFTADGKDVTDAVYFVGLPNEKRGKSFKDIPVGAYTPTVHGVVKVKDGAAPQNLDLGLPGFVLYKSKGLSFSSARADVPHAIVAVPA